MDWRVNQQHQGVEVGSKTKMCCVPEHECLPPHLLVQIYKEIISELLKVSPHNTGEKNQRDIFFVSFSVK